MNADIIDNDTTSTDEICRAAKEYEKTTSGDEASERDEDAEVESAESTRSALIAGLVALVATAGLVGWLGLRACHADRQQQRQEQFVQGARRGASNLTTRAGHGANGHFDIPADGQHDWSSWVPQQRAAMSGDVGATIT